MSLANRQTTDVRARDLIRMIRSLVGIPFFGARNPHFPELFRVNQVFTFYHFIPEYPLIHEILVGIPSSGLGIPNSGDSVRWGFLVEIFSMHSRLGSFIEVNT